MEIEEPSKSPEEFLREVNGDFAHSIDVSSRTEVNGIVEPAETSRGVHNPWPQRHGSPIDTNMGGAVDLYKSSNVIR